MDLTRSTRVSRIPPGGMALLALLFLIPWGQMARATTLDIMLVYDTTATTWVASNGGMTAFSQDVVNRMNLAMQNSNVDISFRLVHAMSVAYTTTSTSNTPLSTDLYALQGGAGAFAPVQTARDTYGADLVAMLVDHGSAYGYVGVGYLLWSWSGTPDYAYTVNAIRSVAISHTLTHEIGHNLGAHHAKNQTSPGPNTSLTNPSVPYSAGWYFTGTNGTKYHSIMAYNYNNGITYQPAPLFSSPQLSYQGTIAGHATDGDNARLLRETKDILALYRTATNPGTGPGEDSSDRIGFWRPSTRQFHLDIDGSGSWNTGDSISSPFVSSTDKPLTGDWNDDGVDEIGVWRPSTRVFYLDLDGNDQWNTGDRTTSAFGISGDVPIAGDWNGDGRDEIGVWRPSTRVFYLDLDNSGKWSSSKDRMSSAFGQSTDKPVIGDWNGDGRDEIGVWRPSTRQFLLDLDGNNQWNTGDRTTSSFGISGDVPIAGDWNDDGRDEIGVWRPSTRIFYLDLDNSGKWSNSKDRMSSTFGNTTDIPVTGRW